MVTDRDHGRLHGELRPKWHREALVEAQGERA